MAENNTGTDIKSVITRYNNLTEELNNLKAVKYHNQKLVTNFLEDNKELIKDLKLSINDTILTDQSLCLEYLKGLKKEISTITAVVDSDLEGVGF